MAVVLTAQKSRLSQRSRRSLAKVRPVEKTWIEGCGELFKLDDPEQWQPPDGATVVPPPHIEKTIRRKKHRPSAGKRGVSLPGTLPAPVQSEIQVRQDFYKLLDKKNLTHVGHTHIGDYLWNENFEQKTGGTTRFLRERKKGWFVLKRLYNPDVFECMAEYIVPFENFEFYSAFEVLLSHLHNSQLVIRMTKKDESVEFWSRKFAKKLQKLIHYRPTTFHTLVIPMIVKPVSQDIALHMIREEWKRIACLASLVIPPASIYARCVNRWIIPLSEPPHEGPDGVLRKSENRQVRLDVGFLMSQRRKFALKNREKPEVLSHSKISVDSYYKVERRKHPGRRLSDHRKLLVPFAMSSTGKMRSLAASGAVRSSVAASGNVRSGVMQRPAGTTSKVESTPQLDGARGKSIASRRGTMRNSQRPGSHLMVSVRKPRFNLDRLLNANKHKLAHEKIYWLYPMRAGRHQPPKTFAKLVKVNQTDDEKAILDMRTEFLNMYYPVAKREKYREAERDQTLLYPQYDQRIVRGMVHDEIYWSFAQAREAIRNSKEDMKEVRQPLEDQKRKLKEAIADMDMKLRPNASETRISAGMADPADSLKNANSADRREYLRILDHKSILPESDEDDEVEEMLPGGVPSRALKRNQIVGNNDLNVVKNWAVLSKFTLAKEQVAKAKHIGGIGSESDPKGGTIIPISGQEGKSYLSIPAFGQKGQASGADSFASRSAPGQESRPPKLTPRQLLLNEDEDPTDKDCIFLKLCVDSGHSNFYFDMGGDSEEEEEDQPYAVAPSMDGQEEEDKTRRRRQSSLVAEGTSKGQFNYLDRNELFKSMKSFRHMNGNLSEKDRLFFLDQEKERKREIERQKELVRQQEIERKRQEELERQRLIELERQRLLELERQRLAELERQRLAELERRRLEELERQRLAEIERQRLEKLRLEELERLRLAELERQRLIELERQRVEKLRLEEIERQRLAELERQRLIEVERQRVEKLRLEEIERQRLAELERQRLIEVERQRVEKLRLEELERKRLAELERQRLEQIRLAEEEKKRLEADRLEKLRLAEEERKRLEAERLERLRLAEEEKKRLEAERLERLRLAEEERKRQEAERLRREEEERLRREEEERKRLEELERQRLAELERQRLLELERQRQAELERLRLEELERQRQAELERKRLEELERRRMLEAERVRLEGIERERLAELERIRLEEEERKRKEEEEKKRLAELERLKKEEAERKRQEEIARQKELERQRAALRDVKKKKVSGKKKGDEEENLPDIPEDQPANDNAGQPFKARLFKPKSTIELSAEDEEDVGEALLDKINEKMHKDSKKDSKAMGGARTSSINPYKKPGSRDDDESRPGPSSRAPSQPHT